ncbi:MAG: hypothetical protein WCP10_04435 [Desulfuromonadales bacterium]
MKRIVDVVNFNADASCLSSQVWLDVLTGGEYSPFVRWLNLYVDLNKKVVLGFPGATVADIVMYNPEAIDLINRNPDVFELILRPFAHDIALLRLGKGFAVNYELGYETIRREFNNISPFFLPPEFMLTNEQIVRLVDRNVKGVFINPDRFSLELKARIPVIPYMLRGLFGITIKCIPFSGKHTNSYLQCLQMFDCSAWNEGISSSEDDVVFIWRDGESSILLPDGHLRESFWLKNEHDDFFRQHIGSLELDFVANESLESHYYRSYPVHSFTAWMKEFRMLGFINRVQKVEERLDRLTEEQIGYWLMSINSDIMSAIEKRSPVISMKSSPRDETIFSYTIQRSERGFEGEEYLTALEATLEGGNLPIYTHVSLDAHLLKLRGRLEYLTRGKTNKLNGAS